MKEDKRSICMVISVLTLLFLALPAVSAHIAIVNIGVYYDGIDRLGYVNYQNVADSNLSGAILVYTDNEIVAGIILEMQIRYVAGFRCSPIKTLEFALNETEGDHHIVALISSDNITAQRTIKYYAAEWWAEQGDEIESELEEEVEEWLSCWAYGGKVT